LPFRQAADSLRVDGVATELLLHGAVAKASEPAAVAAPVLPDEPEELLPAATVEQTQPALAEVQDVLTPVDALALDAPAHDFIETQVVDFSETLLSNFAEFSEDVLQAPPEDPLAPLDVPLDADEPFELLLPETEPESVPQPDILEAPASLPDLLDESAIAPAPAEEQVKVIGPLRIGIPLYNVYLNEADEWSRRLLTELTEWSLELAQPVPDSAIGLAHSLAGSSATVGFMALSELARALEYALEHARLGEVGLPEHAQLFVDAAEDIRRLLHQFAAGFLKQPDPELLAALKAVLDSASSTLELAEQPWPDDELPELDLDFGDVLAPQVPAPETPVAPESASPEVDDAADASDAVDALDVDLFPVFEEEAMELLPQLSAALRQWSAQPDKLPARQEALRILHTLKGSARLAGAMGLGDMAHRMESAVEQIDAETAQAEQITPLLAMLDAITTRFEALRATPLTDLVLPEQAPALPGESGLALGQGGELATASVEGAAALDLAVPASGLAPLTPAPLLRRGSGQTIRVKAQLIDHMVDQAGEVMISRSRLQSRLGQLHGSIGELTTNLSRLRSQLRDLELQSESQMQSRLALAKDTDQGFDPLEFDRFTRVQELTRMMAESVHDVATLQRNLQQTVEGVEDDLAAQARLTRDLQRDLLRTRMVEFDSVAERLHGVVRQAVKDFGKPARLDIHGGSLEMDRGVLERAVPAFEHILRNAVGHGMEPVGARLAAGKPEVGVITLTVEQQSNDVAVTFADDGIGLDLKRIRAKAVTQGLIEDAQVLTDEQVGNLVFSSGLSTAQTLSEMAGRGIGLDVVRSEVNALGGRVELSSVSGQGCEFKLVLPLTTAVNQVVLLRLGDVVIGVPASQVELVRRVAPDVLSAAYSSGQFDYNGQAVAFYWAGALLQTSPASQERQAKTAPVAIFRSAGQWVALHVDEVLGNQEVVVKNLGPQMSRLPGLVGMSALASGAVVLIYNPVALVGAYGEQAQAYTAAHAEHSPAVLDADGATPQPGQTSAASQVPLVLVVDDSITVRRVTQRLLKREGYRVALATDGLQALAQLQQEKPAVVLADIEMPRMDGFDLVRNIRGDEKFKDLPVIMITSRIAEKHRDFARSLGVDHYLGKPYPEEELIALVRGYCDAKL